MDDNQYDDYDDEDDYGYGDNDGYDYDNNDYDNDEENNNYEQNNNSNNPDKNSLKDKADSAKQKAEKAKNNAKKAKEGAKKTGKAVKQGTKQGVRAAKNGTKLAVKAGKAVGQAVKGAVAILKAVISLAIKFWPVTLIILAIILIMIVFWLVLEKKDTDNVKTSIESYVSTDKDVSADFKSKYDLTGSMIYATDKDIKNIADSFLKEIKKTNKAKYVSFKKKYSNGDKDNKISGISGFSLADVNDKRKFIEHALYTEKYNFNRVKWQSYQRKDLLNGSDPTGKVTMKNDKDLSIRYPEFDGDVEAGNDENFYIDMLSPYLQSWIIPVSMVSGSNEGGTDKSDEEDIADDFGSNAYNTKFGYQIISKGYHQVEFSKYELYTRTYEESYRLYDENTYSGVVSRNCVTYTRYKNSKGVTVTAGTKDAVEESYTACNDSQPVYTLNKAASAKYVEFPDKLSSKYYNIKQYFAANHSDIGAKEKKSSGGLSAKDLGNQSNYEADVTKYYGFDNYIEKGYDFTPYDITSVETNSSESQSSSINNDEVYIDGTSSKYTATTKAPPTWSGDKGVTTTKVTSTIKLKRVQQTGSVNTVTRQWSDQLSAGDEESGEYTVDFVSEFESKKDLSTMEKNYYGKLEKSELDAINMVDLINSEPSIYKKYLSSSKQYSKYIGYPRAYLAVSYYVLRDYLEEIAKKGKFSLMWGNSILPGMTVGVAGEAVSGAALVVPSGTAVIYPYSKKVIDSGKLVENSTKIGSSYGYSGHTGFDITDHTAVPEPSNACSDSKIGGLANCPYMKGSPIYATMTGKITSVTYSECHEKYLNGARGNYVRQLLRQ